jgi:Ribonuclease G/E
MKREILISATQREVRVAILEDDQLVELQVERPETRRMVGDIYWGKVESVLPGLQAAFVDIGTDKSAFLHNSDLVYDEGDDDDAEDDGDEPVDVDQPDSADLATVALRPHLSWGPASPPRPRRRVAAAGAVGARIRRRFRTS